MNITETKVTKLTVTGLENLDPINIFLEDFNHGQGRLTIECFGQAWSDYWPAMGTDIVDFVVNASSDDYLANKLKGEIKIKETDISQFPFEINDEDISLIKSGHFPSNEACEKLVSKYGDDWYMDLPQTNTHEYNYLLMVVSAVREALSIYQAKEREKVAEILIENSRIKFELKG